MIQTPVSNNDIRTDSPSLLRTTYQHRSEGCGERIPSPHSACQQVFTSYLVGERLHQRFATIVVCNGCRAAWREVAA